MKRCSRNGFWHFDVESVRVGAAGSDTGWLPETDTKTEPR